MLAVVRTLWARLGLVRRWYLMRTAHNARGTELVTSVLLCYSDSAFEGQSRVVRHAVERAKGSAVNENRIRADRYWAMAEGYVLGLAGCGSSGGKATPQSAGAGQVFPTPLVSGAATTSGGGSAPVGSKKSGYALSLISGCSGGCGRAASISASSLSIFWTR
jgi:hypothetical protein